MNTSSISARDLKENVSLVDLLFKLGYEPRRRNGKEFYYQSMLNEADNDPSFCVNNQLNVWYDHSQGKGGNVIDFALQYWRLSFPETLEKILDVDGRQLPIVAASGIIGQRKRCPVKIPHYQIEEIKNLGYNPRITQYLQSRGVWQAAQSTLKEIYYFVEDQNKARKQFYAAGWQNELGAWEVRNPNFKGCLGRKAISFLPGDPYKLAVFEGYINYLSWLTANPFQDHSVLVLNSIALLNAAVAKAKDYPSIDLFFDRDKTGHQTTIDFQQALPHAVDSSHHYLNFNDYNDKLRDGLKQQPGLSR